tara:strand:- start:591 stop:818 length:228 start_codon:yes stop_codon:yes gene_type:complete
MSKSLIERLRDHLSCYWKEGDVAPQLTSIELMLIEEAANELAAALSQRDGAREWVRATLGSAHLTEMDKFIKEGK